MISASLLTTIPLANETTDKPVCMHFRMAKSRIAAFDTKSGIPHLTHFATMSSDTLPETSRNICLKSIFWLMPVKENWLVVVASIIMTRRV